MHGSMPQAMVVLMLQELQTHLSKVCLLVLGDAAQPGLWVLVKVQADGLME